MAKVLSHAVPSKCEKKGRIPSCCDASYCDASLALVPSNNPLSLIKPQQCGFINRIW